MNYVDAKIETLSQKSMPCKFKMYSLLTTISQPLYSRGTHMGFLVRWNLIAPLVKKWSKNRDPDQLRITEMKEHFHKGRYIPNQIHLAELPNEGLVCYDGNHRREVFNSFPDILCIVDVLFGATEAQVYNEFENINKAVQVPAIYLTEVETSINVRDDIIQLVKTYEQNYKSFLSTSNRCHAPHFNRDMFVDNIYDIYKQFHGMITIKEIGVLLEKLNIAYSHEQLCRPHRLYRKGTIEKCQKHNFWLFIDRLIPFEHLRTLNETPGV
jgi:hypothetical protein